MPYIKPSTQKASKKSTPKKPAITPATKKATPAKATKTTPKKPATTPATKKATPAKVTKTTPKKVVTQKPPKDAEDGFTTRRRRPAGTLDATQPAAQVVTSTTAMPSPETEEQDELGTAALEVDLTFDAQRDGEPFEYREDVPDVVGHSPEEIAAVAASTSRHGNPTDAQTAYHLKNTEMFMHRDQILGELEKLDKLEAAQILTFDDADRRRRLRLSLETVTWEIFEFNKGLIRSYVKKFTSNTSREDSEDFESAGAVGLMRAISTYRVDMGRFGHWAYKPIQREVLRAVRDADYENMNPGDFERRPDILRAVVQLQDGDEDYVPSFEEVAAKAGVTVKQVQRVLNAPHLESLQTPIGEDGDTTVGDLIVDTEADLADSVVSRLEVEALEAFGLTCLDNRELFVLSRRFGLDCEPEQRLSAIGEILGLSREAVRQVESKALAKLMHPVTLRRIARAGRE